MLLKIQFEDAIPKQTQQSRPVVLKLCRYLHKPSKNAKLEIIILRHSLNSCIVLHCMTNSV